MTNQTSALQDKTILVTGAGDGIGKAVAIASARQGATVILLGRTVKKLEHVYDDIEAEGGPQPAIFPLNLENSGEENYLQLNEIVSKEFSTLHGLIHCATNLGSLTPMALYDTELWHKVFQVNVHACYQLTRALIPCLNKSNNASVIFSVSQQALQGTAYWGAFGTTQAALKGMMEIFADEYENDGIIRFNCLDPGPVASHFRRTAYPAEEPATQASPESVVAPYLHLLSESSKTINGKLLQIDDAIFQ